MKFALCLLMGGAFILTAATTTFAATIINEDEQAYMIIVNDEQEVTVPSGGDLSLDCMVCNVKFSGSDDAPIEANENSFIYIVKGKLVVEN